MYTSVITHNMKSVRRNGLTALETDLQSREAAPIQPHTSHVYGSGNPVATVVTGPLGTEVRLRFYKYVAKR